MLSPSFRSVKAKMAMVFICITALFSNANATNIVEKVVFHANFSTNRQHFRYYDDTFRNTMRPFCAKGGSSKKQAALIVQLGGINGDEVWDMSGAWGRKFTLETETNVQIIFELRMFVTPGIDDDSSLDAMLSIDGQAIGSGPGKDFIARLRGKDAKAEHDSEYKTVAINVGRLAKGEHTLLLGGFLLTVDKKNEFARIYIRNVVVKIGDWPATLIPTAPTAAPTSTITFAPTWSSTLDPSAVKIGDFPVSPTPTATTGAPTLAITFAPTRPSTLVPSASPSSGPTDSQIEDVQKTPIPGPTPRPTISMTPTPTKQPTRASVMASVQHLPTKIFNADFQGNDNGFAFVKDTFQNTSNPRFANGWLDNDRLTITLGAVSDENINGMSGAWKRNFLLLRPALDVQIMFDYTVTLSAVADAEKFCQALVLVANSDLGIVATLRADEQNEAQTTGIRKYTVNIGARDPGRYEIRLGGFFNRKNAANETCDISYDNVMILVDYVPTRSPTPSPTFAPTNRPTPQPTSIPTLQPTSAPTSWPTRSPTPQPTLAPTSRPTKALTSFPTQSPTPRPTSAPTSAPTRAPKQTTSTQVEGTFCSRAVSFNIDFGGLAAVRVNIEHNPSLGTVVRSGDQFVYTPNNGVADKDRFVYAARSLNGDSHTVIVTINVRSLVRIDIRGTSMLFKPTTTITRGRTLWEGVDVNRIIFYCKSSDSWITTYKSYRDTIIEDENVCGGVEFSAAGTQTGEFFDYKWGIGAAPSLICDAQVTLIQTNFDKSTDDFHYHDDIFGTRHPRYARGDWWESDGERKLMVILGGIDDRKIQDMSGGWIRAVNVHVAGHYTLKFDYAIYNTGNEEPGEYADAIVEVNGHRQILARIDGTRGQHKVSSGRKTFSERFALHRGGNYITVGAFFKVKTLEDESIVAVFDNLSLKS